MSFVDDDMIRVDLESCKACLKHVKMKNDVVICNYKGTNVVVIPSPGHKNPEISVKCPVRYNQVYGEVKVIEDLGKHASLD